MGETMSWLTTMFKKAPARVVRLLPSEDHFEVGPGQTVLEQALQAKIAYPHDCTVGTCGTCRSRLISGKVEAITPFGYTLSKEELDAGYILACQAIAKSDLVLEVDVTPTIAGVAEKQAATLIHLDDLTHDIKRAVWRVETPVRYRAGQYMNLKWSGDDAARSYSFSTAPAQEGRCEISTFVRHVPGGRFTDHIFGPDPFADTYEVDGPHGNFYLREGKEPLICIAGGSGLAPILSLLQDAASRRVRRDCIVLFGARGLRDLYASEEIAAVRNAWTAGFDFWPILSEETAKGYRHGLVTAFAPAALEKLGPGCHGYMCGPPGMINAAVTVLTAQGITLDHIHYDKFTDASTKA